MERIETSVGWGPGGWDTFFDQEGYRQGDKFYAYLSSVFSLSVMKGSLLDVGCALGAGLRYLKNKAPSVGRFVGTDFSSRALAICRGNPELEGMEFIQHDIHQSFPEQYCNVICLHILEHVDNPQLAVHNLIEATKDLLIVGAPYRNRIPDEDHLWSFDESDFVELVDAYCLDKKQKYIYWLLDKQKKGLKFRPKSVHILLRFMQKWHKHFHKRRCQDPVKFAHS